MSLSQRIGSNEHSSQNHFIGEVVSDACIVTLNDVLGQLSRLNRVNRDTSEISKARGYAIDGLVVLFQIRDKLSSFEQSRLGACAQTDFSTFHYDTFEV